MKRGKNQTKQTQFTSAQFDLFTGTKDAPVEKLTMWNRWDDWSKQYIPHRPTSPTVELDYAV